MKILVTGANGYLGQGIVTQLISDGMTVIATDITVENINKAAIIKPADIFALDDPFNYFLQPDVVLHLAWKNGFIHNDICHIEDISKHYIFIKKLIESGLKHVAVMGSMHEIGFFEGSINEDTPTNPLCLYGIGKDALRRSLELLIFDEVIFQWIRGFYIVGNSLHGSSIFSKITAAELKGEKIFPFTTGQNQWDFLTYSSFCLQVASIVEQQRETGIINACSGRPEKLADCVERFIKENKYKIKLDYGAFKDRPYDSKAVWGDDKKIKSILSIHPGRL